MPLRAALLAADRGPRLRRDRRLRRSPGPDGTAGRGWRSSPSATAEARVSIAHRRLGAGDRPAARRARGAARRRTGRRRDAGAAARALRRRARAGARRSPGCSAALFADEGLLVLDPRDARLARAGGAGLRGGAPATPTPSTAGLDARRAALAARASTSRSRRAPAAPCSSFTAARADGPALPAGASGRTRGAGRRAGWRAGRLRRHRRRRRDRRRARARSAALLDLGAAAADRAGHAAAVGGVRRRARRRSATSRSSGRSTSTSACALPLVVPRARFRCLDAAHPPAARRARPLAPTMSRARTRSSPPAGPARARRAPRIAAALAAPGRRTRSRPPSTQIAAAVESLAPADRNLARAAARTRAHVARALERLTARYARTLAERDGVALGRLARAARRARARRRRRRSAPTPGRRWRAAIGPAALKRLVLDRLDADGAFSDRACRSCGREPRARDRRSGSASSASRPSAAAASSPSEVATSLARRGHAVHVFSDERPRRLPRSRAAPSVCLPPGRGARLPAAQALALHAGADLEDRRGLAPRAARRRPRPLRAAARGERHLAREVLAADGGERRAPRS